jgi:hypothetical protein
LTFAHFVAGYLSQADGLSPEKFLGEAGEHANPDNGRMRAMLLDWSQRVETWQKTKLIADRAMGSFVADKVRISQSWKETGLNLVTLTVTAHKKQG